MDRTLHSRFNNRGFNLLEIAVVLMIIGILAAALTPLVGDLVDRARATRAQFEAQTIASAILNFQKNTGKWPIYTTGVSITTSTPVFQVLAGPGNDPLCLPGSTDCPASWLPSTASLRGDLLGILERNTPSYTTSGRFAWRGPYLLEIGSDSWGNKFIVNASSLQANRAAFVLSAGPDGTIQTAFTQNIGTGSSPVTIGGDDIAARLR